MQPFQNVTYDQQLIHLAQVIDRLLPSFALTPRECGLVQYENNAVYRLTTDSGEQFAVRVAMPWGRNQKEQQSELDWLRLLSRGISLAVPEPIPSRTGDLVIMVDDHPCVMLRWLPGEPPEPGLALETMEKIGAFTATLHRCAEGLFPSVDFVRPRWDREGLLGPRSILNNDSAVIPLSPQQRAVLSAAGDRIGQALSEIEKLPFHQGLIHGDLHLDNIRLYNADVGVIDFDDCGFGYYLYDLACVLDSFNRRIFGDEQSARKGREALIRGYTKLRSLPLDFDRYLAIFMALRDIVTLDFILRSRNENVQRWGRPRLPSLIDQLQSRALGTTM